MKQTIKVLDKGYVSLVTWLPWNMYDLHEAICSGDLERAQELLGKDDLTTVNAAKASFQKSSQFLNTSEKRLINFLAKNHETSPFRHSLVSLEVYAPLFTARQWHKYKVGSRHTEDTEEPIGLYFGQGDQEGFDDALVAWNESSRRYLTIAPEFYVPEKWRLAPDNKKQGSGGFLQEQKRYDEIIALLKKNYSTGLALYDLLNEEGMAPELNRLFLPSYGLYISWRWTASIVSICHFLKERMADNAQYEIQQYAQAIHQLVYQIFPESVNKLLEY